jgi:hypothetical protein
MNRELKFWSKYIPTYYTICALFSLGLHFGIDKSNEPNNHDNLIVASTATQYFSHISKTPVGQGSEVDAVIPLQLLLIESGEDLGRCGADGIYGPSTILAVINYQKRHDLPKNSGNVDTATYDHLVKNVLANKESYVQITDTLIAPYNTAEDIALKAHIGDIFDDTGAELFFRPDALAVGAYEGLFNDEREDAASMMLPGFANNHLRDAFRHSDSVFRIAAKAGTASAITIGDMREKKEFHTLPLFLMDIYNHRAAAKLYEDTPEHILDQSNITEIILEGLKDNKFMPSPFPLINKGTHDEYAYLTQTPQV